ncbi:MAG: MarR family transcriptional regulator [Thermus sp.]|nr:MarR family transcriptional regulator [Thermus sp.]
MEASQGERRQEKLLALLERLAQVERALLTRQAFRLGLTALQAQLLLHLSERPHGVVALAELLSLTPATVSEALSSLEDKGLLTRSKDERDGRRWILKPTEEGLSLVRALKAYAGPLRQALTHVPHQEELLLGLMELLARLVLRGTVPETGLCLTCRHLRRDAAPKGQTHGRGQEEGFFCALLGLALGPWDLRLSCPDHAPA